MQGTRLITFLAAATSAVVLVLAAIASGADLTADFTWDPQQPQPGQQVTFTSTGSGNPTSYAWDLNGDGKFDDGNTPTVTKTYDQAGAYKVALKVTSGNKTAQVQHTIRVASGLESSFTWSPQNPTTADQVTLTSTSTVQSGSITGWSWDLNGDRRFDDAKGESVTYTFAQPGDHQVGLRVTDNTGARATSFNTISVADAAAAPPPPATPAPSPAPAPSGPAWLNPFPSVRIRGFATSGGVHLSLFAARAPVGTTMKVRCRGTRCPHKRTRTYAFKTARMRLRGLERFFPAGTRIEVFIWKKGMVGKYTRLVMRRAKPPARTDECLFPGGKWPGRCP